MNKMNPDDEENELQNWWFQQDQDEQWINEHSTTE